MRRIVIDMQQLETRQELHRKFREELEFPAYYGNNLDALHDMLSVWQEPLEIEVTAVEQKWPFLLRMLKDVCSENPRLKLQINFVD